MVFCDQYGAILEILLNPMGWGNLAVGSKLNQLFSTGSQFKLIDFMAKLRAEGIQTDWEFSQVYNGNEVLARVSGVRLEERFLIICDSLPPHKLELYRELMLMNNEQTNALRQALKEKTQIAQPADPNARMFEEISRINNELVSLQRELARKNKELERLYSEVQALSVTDALTGLLNRRGFAYKAEQAWQHALRYERPISVVMLDIDHFKQVNDTYGHAIGDVVLKEVAKRSQSLLRSVDILCRYGGEEFCLLLPEADQGQAVQIAKRLRLSVSPKMETTAGALKVTISLGVAQRTPNHRQLEELIEHADQALYQAKQGGRDRVCVFKI